MAAKPVFTTTLSFAKETKGTWVFRNYADDAPISSLYVSKDAMPIAPSELEISVTVSA
jgi:hypothetical protein